MHRLALRVWASLSHTMGIFRIGLMPHGKVPYLFSHVERMYRRHLHDLSWRVDEWHLCKTKWPRSWLRQPASQVLCQPPKHIRPRLGNAYRTSEGIRGLSVCGLLTPLKRRKRSLPKNRLKYESRRQILNTNKHEEPTKIFCSHCFGSCGCRACRMQERAVI